MKKTLFILFWLSYVVMGLVLVGHSCMNGEVSTEESNVVGRILDSVLSVVVPDPTGAGRPISLWWDGFQTFVRKGIGHFGGFFVFGFLGYFAFFFSEWKESGTIFGGVGVALFTEFIQLFTDGRSGQFSDVLIDVAGYLAATVILYFIVFFVPKRPRLANV